MSNKIMEIDTNIFKQNIIKIKEFVGNKVTIMPVIKANGYGTYINKNLKLIDDFEIIAVATVDEGVKIRNLGFKNQIFILNQPTIEEIYQIVKNNLIIGICSEKFLKYISNLNYKFRVHLEIETGMGRTGIYLNQLINF